jgi:hypothetical protein
MSSCSNFYRKHHNFDHSSNSGESYGNTCDTDAFLYDETEPPGDSIKITINSENMTQLYNESKGRQVSLNTRINQIIKDHLNWHTNAPAAKMYYLPKSCITKVIDQLTEPQISVLALDVARDFKDICLMLRGEFTISSFLDVVVNWLQITKTPNRTDQNMYEYNLLVKHDMGYKYSFLVKEVCRDVIDHTFHMETEFVVTENSLGVKIMNINDSYQSSNILCSR